MKEKRAERRRFIRFDFNVNIKFRFAGNISIDSGIKGKAKNLSAEGVCIVTQKEIPRNEKIELDIFLPGRKRYVRVHGRVVWVHRIRGADKDVPGRYESGIKLYTAERDDENILLKYYCERMVDNLNQYLDV